MTHAPFPVPTPRRRRGAALLAVLAAFAVAACAGPAEGPGSTGTDPERAQGFSVSSQDERLVVADVAADAIHTYSVPEHEHLGTIEDVAVSDHAGFVQLEDGRLLVAGTEPSELLALDVTGQEPQVIGRVALPGSAVHITVDPVAGLAAVSTSAGPDTGKGAVTVVDLESFEATGSVPVATEEPGIALVDGALVHRDGAESGLVELLPLPEAGSAPAESTEPAATARVGAYGHGEAVVDGHLLVATDAGLERLHVETDHLAAEDVVPWVADGNDWGRAYYLRVLGADQHVWSYVRDQASESWGEWRNDLWVLAPGEDTAQRRPLGNGLAFRFAVSEDRVLFARMHPDGYVAHVVDADPDSPTFVQTLHSIDLPTPTGAPAPEDDMYAVWESAGRPIAALTAAGTTGYVSRGGDGVIDVLDTAAGAVTGAIEVPTPLDGGGYVVVARPGAQLLDGLGR